jgi:aryl-alcohol dehydrogenase-like predicted oxidoreductase
MDCRFSDEKIERGGEHLNRLALGTAQFGLSYGIANERGQISLDEARAILKHARASGMNTLDTAISYGDSERRLGEIGVQGWQIVSKLPNVPNGCSDITQWVASAVLGSLERLKVTSIYGLLLHRPQQLLEAEGDQLYRSLQQLKNDGLVYNIGVSIYDPAELGSLYDRFNFDIVQSPFNLLDHRMVESGWFERLSRRGVEVHVRSIFLQGLLLLPSHLRPDRFNRWQPFWNRLNQWLSATGITPLQACLRHALAQTEIDRIIIGVDSLSHLNEALRAVDGGVFDVPPELHCDDLDLINPTRWSAMS